MLFDTHTHSYFFELADRQEEIIGKMKQNNVRYATQIGCDIETNAQAVELAKKYDPYFATVGYHPTEGQNLSPEDIKRAVSELERLVLENKGYIVAIGEIGFDYYYLDPDLTEIQKEAQRSLFFAMTGLAVKYNFPIVIHTRNARDDTLRYIKESGIKKAIIHCFSEDYGFAEELMDYSNEIFFSFSGIVTYKKSVAIQEAARLLPLDRILIETDAPFLAPQAVRGTINQPANVRYVLETVQHLRTENPAEVEKAIFENSLRVYGI